MIHRRPRGATTMARPQQVDSAATGRSHRLVAVTLSPSHDAVADGCCCSSLRRPRAPRRPPAADGPRVVPPPALVAIVVAHAPSTADPGLGQHDVDRGDDLSVVSAATAPSRSAVGAPGAAPCPRGSRPTSWQQRSRPDRRRRAGRFARSPGRPTRSGRSARTAPLRVGLGADPSTAAGRCRFTIEYTARRPLAAHWSRRDGAAGEPSPGGSRRAPGSSTAHAAGRSRCTACPPASDRSPPPSSPPSAARSCSAR